MTNREKRRIVAEFINDPSLMGYMVKTADITRSINLKHGTTFSVTFVKRVIDEKEQLSIETMTGQPQLFPTEIETEVENGTSVEETTMNTGTDLVVLASGWVRSQDNGESQPVDFDQIWKRAGYTLRENAIRAFKLAMRNFKLVEGIEFTSLKTDIQNGPGRPGQTFVMTVGAAKRFMAAAQTPEGFACIDILITEEEKYAELKARIARGESINPEQPKSIAVVPDQYVVDALPDKTKIAEYFLHINALGTIVAMRPDVNQQSVMVNKFKINCRVLNRPDIAEEYLPMMTVQTGDYPKKFTATAIGQKLSPPQSPESTNLLLKEVGFLKGEPKER